MRGSSVRESDLRHPTKAGSQMVLWKAHIRSKTGNAKQTVAEERIIVFRRKG